MKDASDHLTPDMLEPLKLAQKKGQPKASQNNQDNMQQHGQHSTGELTFALVRHPADTQQIADNEAKTWPAWCAMLSTYEVRDGKSDHKNDLWGKMGPGFIPAVMPAGHRKKSAPVGDYTALVLDIEPRGAATPPPPEEAAARLASAGLAGMVYTSHNHMAPAAKNYGKPPAPRYRVVVPLAKSMPSERSHLQANAEKLAERLDLLQVLDPSSTDKGRLFFLPSRRTDAPHFAQAVQGEWWQPVEPQSQTGQHTRVPAASAIGESGTVTQEQWGKALAALEHFDPDDYAEWLTVGMALHHTQREEAFTAWCEWSSQSVKYEPKESAKKWESFSYRLDGTTIGTLIQRVNERTRLAPSFAHQGGTFELLQSGLFFVTVTEEGQTRKTYLSPPVEVVASTRTLEGRGWGRLLRWKDAEGRPHEWAMPLEMLQGDGAEMRRTLADRGLSVSVNYRARGLFAAYVQAVPAPKMALCLERTGWNGGMYALPHRIHGQGEGLAVYQGGGQYGHGYTEAGTLDQWRNKVSRYAVDNSRLCFAVSAAFAGPLLELAGMEGGGYHFRGSSSSGKSTAVDVAASVWGKPDQYRRRWRNTANGLEALATLHNDGLLVLDEIRQADPKALPDIVMMLGNGQGKGRMDKHLSARPAAQWKLVYLSSGEEGLEALAASVGKTTKAGDEIRLADIPADAGAGYGLLENLHGQQNGAALADLLKANSAKFYGTPAAAWLDHLTGQTEQQRATIAGDIQRFTSAYTPQGAGSQVERVCKRFALVAVAGERATAAGLTGWPAEEAVRAAGRCFRDWLASFGGIENREQRTALQQVRAFIEAHGGSRFEVFHDGEFLNRERIHNRAGFIKATDSGREYLIQREQFRLEVCKGLDHEAVALALRDAGHLKHQQGRLTGKARHPETRKSESFYIVKASILQTEPDDGQEPEESTGNGLDCSPDL